MKKAHFILYVQDQARSREFYSRTLATEPFLDVPGMTEYELPGAAELSPLELRDWGHRAAYSLDPDGHVLAFAESWEAGP